MCVGWLLAYERSDYSGDAADFHPDDVVNRLTPGALE